jgi:hypothetical protein
MARFHTTAKGNIPFTAEEEALKDQEEAEYAAGADDREAAAVRGKRNFLLTKTDFHALSDTDMSEAMTTYRQALRDIPTQAGFPNEINWPTEPV